ncbi:MAG TPA: serine hydroxymethyltransferase, partial [Caulobacterales bacterium]|nr:serine hydroxymethyltransferase [Caulobacterales bacterium]
KNGIPFDPEKPMVTSGVRVGSPAGTTRGFGPAEFRLIADLMVEVIDGLSKSNGDNTATETAVAAKVEALTAKFPIYS